MVIFVLSKDDFFFEFQKIGKVWIVIIMTMTLIFKLLVNLQRNI